MRLSVRRTLRGLTGPVTSRCFLLARLQNLPIAISLPIPELCRSLILSSPPARFPLPASKRPWTVSESFGVSQRCRSSTLNCMSHATDLTDAQWELLEPLLGHGGTRRPAPVIDRRQVVNAVLYQAKTGCQRRTLPAEFGNKEHDLEDVQPVARPVPATRSPHLPVPAGAGEGRPGPGAESV